MVRDSGGHARPAQRRRRRRRRAAGRAAPGRSRRRGRALLHVGHDRHAEGRGAHPPRPRGPGGRRGAVAGPPAPRRGRHRLPVAHIMGFAVLMGLAFAGIPTYLLPRFNPVKVLEAIERGGPRCSSACRPCTGCSTRPAPRSTTSRRCGSGPRVPTPCRRPGASGSRRWAPPSPCRCSARWARPPSPRATAWSRSAGGVAGKVSPPTARRGPRRGARVRAPRLRAARGRRATGPRCRPARSASSGQGPRRPRRLLGRRGRHRRGAHRGRWLRTGDLARKGPLGTVVFVGRRSTSSSTAATRCTRSRSAGPRAAPEVLEAAVVGLPDDRLGEIPAAAVRLVDGARSRTRARGVGRRAPGRLQGAQALGGGRRAAPHRHHQGPEGGAPRPLRLTSAAGRGP